MRIRMPRTIWLLIGLLPLGAHAAQIYLCKTSQGAQYWSSDWCNKSGGYTVNAVTVPTGMPFQEQAKIGDQLMGRQASAVAEEDAARDRARTCGAIDRELAEIWSRYDKSQFNEVAQIGRDQTRTHELKARRNSLGCQTR
jgi:hypothetical protein